MSTQFCVFIVDDEYVIRHSLGLVMETRRFCLPDFRERRGVSVHLPL